METKLSVRSIVSPQAVHTVQQALTLSRAVGAVPGPVTSAASTGTNRLLQEGQAQVITNGTDVVRLLDGMRDPVHSATGLNTTRLAQARPAATSRTL